MSVTLQYRGRFAPSPTGPLHFGSLIAALGSYLEAKKHNGIWLVRMEDLDSPRTVPGAADDILRTLEFFGMHSDEKVLYQSQRTDAYLEALDQLKHKGMAYPCTCSRREIADSALLGIEGPIYPGTCRNGIGNGKRAQAWRVLTDKNKIEFVDTLQGCISQNLEDEIGDFVILRADGLFAYQLAVVVDDEHQGINNIVRGADLLTSTPRQIRLQRLLNYSTPFYLHLPVAVNAQGEKLSKQTLAPAVDCRNPAATLLHALHFLGQNPPAELAGYKVEEILTWAIENWESKSLNNTTSIVHA
jgi:glutamyl-Q tRNA(Asp) synthetase